MADDARARRRAWPGRPDEDRARELMARARELREAAGVAQNDMAREVGCAKSTLCQLEASPPAALGRDPSGYRQRWIAILEVLDATSDGGQPG